jgi:serine/threonine protein phosphatase PrpC
MGNLLGAPIVDKETHRGRVDDDDIEFAVSSMQGWRVHMEDAHICEPKLYALQPAYDDDGSTKTNDKSTKIDLPGHSLYAVFDGHGGTFAAYYSGKNMLRVLGEQAKFTEYAKFVQERPTKEPTLMNDSAKKVQYLRSGLDLLEDALRDAFIEMDKEIANAIRGTPHPLANTPYHPETPAAAAAAATVSTDTDSNSDMKDAVFDAAKEAVSALDDEGDSGTTACVVLVTPDWIVCANAGDSRSVCSKSGNRAVPLSYDHKPDDEEEERRIRAAGGYVAGGRVEGDLAVSRGLGDFRFKSMATVCAGAHSTHTFSDLASGDRVTMGPGEQKVSSVPDIIVQNRNAEHDEFIIVACDGIWDVQSNHEFITEVAGLFQEGESDLGLLCEEVRRKNGGGIVCMLVGRGTYYFIWEFLTLCCVSLYIYFIDVGYLLTIGKQR